MNTVWKFPLKATAEPQDHEMPVGAQIVRVSEQFDDICIWAVVDPGYASVKTRTFVIAGTGAPCPSAHQYIGSAVFRYREVLIFHVFEVTA